ncbi:MAG: hypothetical protein J0H44_11755 [Alphaproteobacteria bacterium]|nr:hypothetical protein [Alphaproteobacteria bacterium]
MSYEILKQAIEARQSLTGIYDDYVRFFSPHTLGRGATGEPSVLCFQYGGGQPSGRLPPGGAWCVFAVSRLHAVEPSGDPWSAGPPESKPSALMAEIDLDSSVDERMRA